ncbi:hypothetical protein AAIE21_22245 [Paenibacillus sp. 102]|uniref:hypothetical protein n=1 Tax=Paenibacillus sp. 102 TaxID=3120823 RepID=UPI0031BA6F82
MNKAMETFLEFLKEIIKGVLRESIAHLYKKHLEKEKSTLSYRRRKQKKKGGSRKTKR